MIVVAELKKPCTDKERANFIVENNHQKGYQIKETKIHIQAWGFTEEELKEQKKQQEEQQAQAEYEQSRLPNVEETLMDLAMIDEEYDNSLLEVADYIVSLEERIIALEEKLNG